MTTYLTSILLILGVGSAWLGALALLKLSGPYDRLHVPGYVCALGGLGIAGAVIASDPLSAQALKAVLIYVALLATNAILTHAIGRMLRLRGHDGDHT